MISRWFRLWLLVFLLCLGIAELGHLLGFVPRPVLDGLLVGAERWWGRPGAFHLVALVGLAALALGVGRALAAQAPRPRSRAAWALTAAVVLLGVYLCLNQFTEMRRVVSQVTDFGTIHLASKALFSGGDPYAATSNGYFYPPLLSFLFGPLTWLPPAGASLLFFCFKFVLVTWTLVACDRFVGGDGLTGGRRVLFGLGLVFVAARFWVTDLQFGNTNSLIMFLFVAAIVLDHDDRPALAGLALALAVSIKILPVVLCLHLLIGRRWRTLAAFAAATTVLNLMPVLLLQGRWWDVWRNYLDAGVAGKLSQRLAEPDNQSLWGLISRVLPTVPLSGVRGVWLAASILLGIYAGLVSLAARRRDPLARKAAAAQYPLLGLLVSPGSWVVHYTAVLLPMAVLWMMALSGRWSGRVAWPLFFITNLAFTMSGWARLTVRASITQSWFALAAILLMVGLGARVLASPAGSPENREQRAPT